MTFRIITIVVYILSSIWVFRLVKRNNLSIKDFSNYFWNSLKVSWKDMFKLKSMSLNDNLQTIRSFVLLITLLEFKVMAITGFLTIIFTGVHLTGLLLLIHVTVAPLISISFAVLVILYAHTNRFDNSDLSYIKEIEAKRGTLNISGQLKLIFWSIAVLSIPAMLSIILGMFPLFGTEGQKNLLEVHRYSVLMISVLVIFYIGLLSVNNKQILNNK